MRILLGICLVMAALIAASSTASAQPQLPQAELSWRNVEVGGRKSAVFSIFRDSRGLMWLGTNGGLYLYDGVTTHAVGAPEFGGTQIYAIVEKDRKLYLGSNNGLLVFDYTTGTIVRHPSATPPEIRTLLAIGDDLWIGSLNGIYRLNLADGNIFDESDGLPHRSVYALLLDSRGSLYVGTYGGLAVSQTASRTFRPIVMDADTGSSHFVNCLLEGSDGNSIYIGGEGFLLRYHPSTNDWQRIADVGASNIKCLAHGGYGHVLAGTDNGVFELSGDSAKHYRHDSRLNLSLADNEIWSIYLDPEFNLWAGHERGVSIASNSSSIITISLGTLTQSGEGNEIHSILRDSRNDLWFAGSNGAIRLSAGAEPAWYRHSTAPNSLSHNRVRAMLEDSEHRIWLATDAGINLYDRHAGNFRSFHIADSAGTHVANWVYALVEDGTSLWSGSFLSGLHRIGKEKLAGGPSEAIADYALNAETPTSGGDTLANNLVNSIIRDFDGNLWLLMFRDNSLTRLTPHTGAMKNFDIHELTGEYPASIALDACGRIWCAFRGGVVVFYSDGTHRTARFPHTDSDESILAMAPVDADMWISTQSNLWKVDGVTLNVDLLPIPQKSYTALYADSGNNKVYLGGTDEILVVDKSIAVSDPDFNSIKMILTGDAAGHLDLSDIRGASAGLTLPYGGSLRLIVSTLNYTPGSVQRYMYKLADTPADTAGQWIVMPEGANAISFSDLTMGRYSLLVRTASAPGNTLAIPVVVRSPWWLSWWAITLYALTMVAAVVWYAWFMRRRNLRALREEQRREALRNVERKLDFLSSISHDLKTPLSMILGPVSLMKEKTRDPGTKKSLEKVYDNAVRLNNMIHRTLELQNLDDAAEDLLIISTFDVVEFCRSVFEVFRENNTQKNFVFHSSCPRLTIEADAVKFESVITNLLSNACKYSEPGATVSMGINNAGNKVEIVVSDDGVGIADKDQSLVFQRMFRAHATAGQHEGTGLGLYLIKKYLELMNGNIDLYSKEGQGTSFVVTLPLSENAAPAEEPHGSGCNTEGRAKILIVEDNAHISGFLTEILESEYTCITAENGRAGLAIAASFGPDLIIADEMMPIMNGMEMVRRIKQNPRMAATPIIMLTAKTDNRTENESIKLGVDIFMPKPFEVSTLLTRVKHLLRNRRELREKVRIETITEAEARPLEAESVNEKMLAKIAKVIEDNISDIDLNVNMLCEKSGISNKQLYRLVRKYIGMAPLDYIRSVRLRKAAVLLSQRRFTVAEVSYMVGFKTPSYFAKCFQAHYGVTPGRYTSDDETPDNK